MISLSALLPWSRAARMGGMLLVLTALTSGMALADVKLRAGDGKRSKDDVFIPEARDVSASFVAGSTVDIELVGTVGTLKQADFVVRQLPEHGTLTNLRPHPRESNKSLITYTHAGEQAGLFDKFTYSVRVDGGPFSAPATVSLRGQRMEPILSIVKMPSFGRVFLGGEATGTVSVRNMGRAPYRMNMVWSEGWAGPATLEVNPGDTVDFQMTFKPVRPGEVRHEIELQPGVKTSKLTLFGEGVRALTVSPGYLTLDYNRTTGVRSGILTLVNGRSDPMKVTLKFPIRLLAPASLEIPPQQKAEVLLQLPATDVPQFLGEVVVESDGVSEKVAVQSRPKPAELKLVSPEKGTLDFGQVTQRKATSRDIILANTGGELLVVEVQARNPYVSEFSGQALRLEPGQQRSVKVFLKSESLGNVISDLRIIGGASESVVTLKSYVREVTAPEATPVPPVVAALPAASSASPAVTPTAGISTPSAAPAAVDSAAVPTLPVAPAPVKRSAPVPSDAPRAPLNNVQNALAAYLATEGLPMPSSFINPHLDRVNNVELVDRETSNFTIAWKKPGVAPAGWALETASMAKDERSNLFIKTWNRVNHWKTVSGDNDKVVVKVLALRPASQYEMRVRGVDRDGKFSEPSPIFVVTTPEPWRVPAWAWRGMLVSALLVVIYMLWRARRGDFEFA
ncbi:fibronectin type III domain-containing protein [Verrucomicrobium sp. BvORR106]|uniref:fibronectin type III domain-containing protein n=1 Tax=Verrucomicrobium sp. BvORR106 TaxID=1403819 RepID=UPI0005714D76|nr:fibronectin type III domain-containing protein [Verrucomicrobium sp. BvORR106]